MTRNRRIIIACCFITVLLGVQQCGTVASVRPLGKGKSSVALSSGGPVAPVFDIKMPIPYSVLRYRRGLTDNMDLHCGIHPTMMVLGNIGLDVGVTRCFVQQSGWRPILSFEGTLYAFYHMNDFSSIRLYPEIGLIGSYSFSQNKHAFYFGIQNMVQYTNPYFVSVPLIGAEFTLGRFLINLEGKWYAPTENSADRVVDYTIIPAEHGAIGFVWGLSYKF